MNQHRYDIRVEGQLSADWSDWFDGLKVCQMPNGETVLSGRLDQAALHGFLDWLYEFNLPLISVQLVGERQ